MATRPVLRYALRLACIVLAASVLAAGPALLPPTPLEASNAAPAVPAGPLSPAPDDPGNIAYVKFSTGDIHLISPDGTNDRVFWANPMPDNPPIDLAWRPDGVELAFSSQHELACSWFDSDIYAIRSDGTGYRRITNAPACAGLAALPKGNVTVEVTNYLFGLPVFVYVAGAPGIKQAATGVQTMTFDNVADFGPNVYQPAVAIVAQDRTLGGAPLADVQPGQTVPGGVLIVTRDSSIRGVGAGKVSWKADGSALGYNMRICSAINSIPAVPPYGQIGDGLKVVTNATPCIMTWNPTLAGREEYLYFSSDVKSDAAEGVYLNTVGSTTGGDKLLSFDYWFNGIFDIEWLPDGSGFIYSKWYLTFNGPGEDTCGTSGSLGPCSNIFEYSGGQSTQLTNFSNESATYLTVSPDGEHIVFESPAGTTTQPKSNLWMMNRNGSDLHKIADNAGRPAWGRTPPPPPPRNSHGYLPMALR